MIHSQMKYNQKLLQDQPLEQQLESLTPLLLERFRGVLMARLRISHATIYRRLKDGLQDDEAELAKEIIQQHCQQP